MNTTYKTLWSMLLFPVLFVVVGVSRSNNNTHSTDQSLLFENACAGFKKKVEVLNSLEFPFHALSKASHNVVMCYTPDKLIPLVSRDINELDADGYSPLHYAVRYGNLMMVYYLLKCGADPNIHDKARQEDGTVLGYTPLHYAFSTGLFDFRPTHGIIQDLFEYGADDKIAANGAIPVKPCDLVPLETLYILFHVPYSYGSFAILRLTESLIMRGADVNGYDTYGYTSLHNILKGGWNSDYNADYVEKAVSMLLRNGADPNLPDQARREDGSVIGYTPLQYAQQFAKNNNQSKAARVIIQKLLDAGACERAVSVARE